MGVGLGRVEREELGMWLGCGLYQGKDRAREMRIEKYGTRSRVRVRAKRRAK